MFLINRRASNAALMLPMFLTTGSLVCFGQSKPDCSQVPDAAAPSQYGSVGSETGGIEERRVRESGMGSRGQSGWRRLCNCF